MRSAAVFRCCTGDDGSYLGTPAGHDPRVAGDGPWYLAVVTTDGKGETRSEQGFGTRDEAIAALNAMVAAGLTVESFDIEDAYPDGI